jgi:hypothetical protein
MAGLMASLLVPLAASPAQAATCSSGAYFYYDPGVEAGASFNWQPQCSDGVAQIWNGRVYDPLCDARSAYAWFEVYDRNPNGTYRFLGRSPTYKNGGGCGSSATFPTWRVESPGAFGWKVVVYLRACSGFCSSTRTYTHTG